MGLFKKKKLVVSSPQLQVFRLGGGKILVHGCTDPTAFTGRLEFHMQVAQDLEKIEGKAVGAQLLQELHTNPHEIHIHYKKQGNAAKCPPAGWYELRWAYNNCQANSAEPPNPRDERVSKPGMFWFKTFGDELTKALQDYDGGKKSLVKNLLAATLYSWKGTAHPSPLYDLSVAQTERKKHVEGKVDDWLSGRVLPSFDQADLLLQVMEPCLKPGDGQRAIVWYDPEWDTGRPPVAGLFHELVHAYYTVKGRQLGVEDSSEEYRGGRHFELMSVGLPPFNTRPYSENKFRQALPWPDRTEY